MLLTLPPELEALVNQKVADGLYPSSLEVIEMALRLLDEQDRGRTARLAALKTEVSLGLQRDLLPPGAPRDCRGEGAQRMA